MKKKERHWLRRKRTWMWFVGLTASIVVYCGLRIIPVVRLENSIERPFEICFNLTSSRGDGRPPLLSEDIDYFFAKVGRAWGEHVVYRKERKGTHNVGFLYATSYQNRLRAPFRGPVRKILIGYGDQSYSSFGEALAGFPFLESLEIYGDYAELWDRDSISRFLQAIAATPRLKELTIDTTWLDLIWLQDLEGCPQLERLTFERVWEIGNFSPKRFLNLADSIPTLKEINFSKCGLHPDEISRLKSELEAAFSDRPHIKFSW